MDEEMKTLMRRNIELTRENNKLLKKIRRNSLIANIMRIVWIVIIVGVPLFLYQYVLQPYLAELGVAYETLTGGFDGAQNALYDLPLINSAIENFLGVDGNEEALREALPEYYRQAIIEHDVDVIAPPDLDITSGELVPAEHQGEVRLGVHLLNGICNPYELTSATEREECIAGVISVACEQSVAHTLVGCDLRLHLNQTVAVIDVFFSFLIADGDPEGRIRCGKIGCMLGQPTVVPPE